MALLRIVDLSAAFSRQTRRSLVEELAHSVPAEVAETGADHEADVYFVEPLGAWHPGWLDRNSAGERGFGYFLDEVPEPVRARIRQRRATLVVNGSTEAAPFIPAIYESFQREISLAELPFENVILLTGNGRFPEAHAEYCREFESSNKLKVLYHNVAYLKGPRGWGEEYGGRYDELVASWRAWRADAPGARDFLSFNLAPRPHRILLVANLLLDGLLDRGLVSFPDLNVGTHKAMDSSAEYLARVLKNGFGASDQELLAVETLRSMGRITIDETSVDHFLFEYTMALGAHARTGFSIVTETEMYQSNVGWLTEKSLKPFICLHPYYVLGSPRTLADLRDIGFVSFSPFLNESYDEIENPKDRFRAAYAAVKQTLALSPSDREGIRRDLWGVLDHNARHVLFGLKEVITKKWTRPLLDVLADRITRG